MFFGGSARMAAVAVFVGWSLFCHSMPSLYPKLDEKRMRHTREIWIGLEKDWWILSFFGPVYIMLKPFLYAFQPLRMLQ